MKKIMPIIAVFITLFIASYAVAVNEVNKPFYEKKFHVVVEESGDCYLSTSFVEGVNTLKSDVGYAINRENGIWERDEAWGINLRAGSATKDALISDFENKIVPLMDKAFPADMKLTVSVWLVSNRVLVMFDRSYWRDKEFHEHMCEKINALL
jgi:hypothetical protein